MGGKRLMTAVVSGVLVLVMAACSDDSEPDAEPASTSASSIPSTTAPATEAPTTSSAPPETSSPSTSAPVTTSAPATTAATATTAPERDFSALGPMVQGVVDEFELGGAALVVVDRDDGIVHEEYWGAFDADRQSFIASSSKMITAGVLMRLDDQGLLDMDTPIAEQTDWVGNPDLTPAQLVSNTSGLVGLFPELFYEPYVCQWFPDGDIEDCGATIFQTPDDDDLIVPPDSGFAYGGGQWQIAGALAEHVSGRTWAELIDETYVTPCGVDSLGYNNHFVITRGLGYPYDIDPTTLEPTDNPNMEAGAYIAAPDYGELLLMHLREGRCGDEQVISPEGIEQLHTDRTITLPGGDALPGYAMGWWVDRANGRLNDPGAFGAEPWIDLELGYGAYFVVEADGSTGATIRSVIEPVIDEVMTASP